ncbi:uncharacterized protein LOC111627915 [Centruroides sculpturatus]|uniref:uncharacterized protein LOC111627915 n=1 Tax=Centruroides sculpturatus TaxID=218467 RepID=UPI000C6CABEC|nr:uncharacterized protein LOC111627915 [Centruroides sculpturatus]
MILQLKLSFVLITYSSDLRPQHFFDKSISSKFIQKDYIVHVVKEHRTNEVTFFYNSGHQRFAFTESVKNSSFIEVEKSYVKICKDYKMTYCKTYNRTKITEKKSFIPERMKVGVEFDDEDSDFLLGIVEKKKKTFIERYIDLLADGLHTKLRATIIIQKADIAIHSGNIRKTYLTYSSSVTHIPTTFAIRAARPLDKALVLVKPFDVMVMFQKC